MATESLLKTTAEVQSRLASVESLNSALARPVRGVSLALASRLREVLRPDEHLPDLAFVQTLARRRLEKKMQNLSRAERKHGELPGQVPPFWDKPGALAMILSKMSIFCTSLPRALA